MTNTDTTLLADAEELREWLVYQQGHAEPRVAVVERLIKALASSEPTPSGEVQEAATKCDGDDYREIFNTDKELGRALCTDQNCRWASFAHDHRNGVVHVRDVKKSHAPAVQEAELRELLAKHYREAGYDILADAIVAGKLDKDKEVGLALAALQEISARVTPPVPGEAGELVAKFKKGVSFERLSEDVGWACGGGHEFDPTYFAGHQMTGINFNSLGRIIDKHRLEAAAHLTRLAGENEALKAERKDWMDGFIRDCDNEAKLRAEFSEARAQLASLCTCDRYGNSECDACKARKKGKGMEGPSAEGTGCVHPFTVLRPAYTQCTECNAIKSLDGWRPSAAGPSTGMDKGTIEACAKAVRDVIIPSSTISPDFNSGWCRAKYSAINAIRALAPGVG